MKITLKKPVKVIQQKTALYVSVPSTVKDILHIEKGDFFTVEVEDGKIIYTKVKEMENEI